ncbi:contractile injection system protein, VgrG/Pvc8 family [Paenibacillus sp. GD4]|jgi:uncharacterized protein|uniref:phage late control D family protein n=1 Tax=Paenibacillus sp. GD4 TaxID=3068890 RepID=UPI002796D7FD|nr:contractile injection system protein, VgrG/Pvc8 family [Paenibacillus sp. GD4]MDQ1909559.1 contractile injection system protein, VgrG/Pvc8 family [Paenibacillus sp. GD4]
MPLSTTSYQVNKLAEKYAQFFAPAHEILIDGTEIVKQKQVAVSSITVQTSVEPEANMAEFTVVNAYKPAEEDFQWLDDVFVLGKTMEVKLGYVDKLELMFHGVISSVAIEYPEGGTPTIRVKGLDKSSLMMKGTKFRSWTEKKYSEVVKEVASTYVSDLVIDDTTNKISTIVQSQVSDFKFIEHLAYICNYDFFLVDKTLYFRKPLTSMTPVLTLSYGQYLRSFTADMNLAEQLTKVTVRGWSDKEQKTVESSAATITKLGSNAKTGKDLLASLGEFEEHLYTNVDSADEAKAKAEAILGRKAMKLITGDGECIGIPEIKAGRYIKLDGLGKKLNQPFYVTGATHRMDSEGYSTSFQVQGNAV